MRQLRKQVLLVLCVMACLLGLTACQAETDKQSTLGDSESMALQQSAEVMLKGFAEVGAARGEELIAQYRDNDMEVMAVAMENYMSVSKDLGAFVSTDSGWADKTDDGYTIILNASFEKRKCEFTITLDKRLEQVTSVSFNPVYTTGENMTKAALNTLMGMGTVFVVLIFISWLISCFRYVRRFEDKMKKKTPAAAPVVSKAPTALAVSEPSEELTDDLELVAVITAAIAASTGASADGLVVRSIRRAPGSKWKRA